MAIVDRKVYEEVIRALLVVVGTVLIGLTTPKPNNFVTEMALMKNADMTPMHNVIHKTTVCKDCQKLPLLEDQIRCDHVKLPSWKSRASQKKNAEVARRTGTVEMTAREDCGILLENSYGCLFSKSRLVEMFNISNPRNIYNDINYKPERIFVVCDPNADGSSYTGVASGFWAKNPVNKDYAPVLVVLGLDLISTPDSQSRDAAIRNHILSIKMMINGAYADVPIIFVPENNSGHASRLEEHVRDLTYVRTIKQPGTNKFGICKTQIMTLDYVTTFDAILYSKQLMFSSKLFTNSTQFVNKKRGMIQTSDSDESIVAQEYMHHLSLMRRIPNKDGTLSNKINGKEGGMNDDGAVTMFMLCYWSKAVSDLTNPEYEMLRSVHSVDIGGALYDYASRNPSVTPEEIVKRYPRSLNVSKFINRGF